MRKHSHCWRYHLKARDEGRRDGWETVFSTPPTIDFLPLLKPNQEPVGKVAREMLFAEEQGKVREWVRAAHFFTVVFQIPGQCLGYHGPSVKFYWGTDDPLILIRFYYGPKWQQQINSGVFALSKFCLTVNSFKAIKEFRDEYHFMLLSSVAHCMDKLRVLLVRELPSRAWRESSVSHQPEHPCPNPP